MPLPNLKEIVTGGMILYSSIVGAASINSEDRGLKNPRIDFGGIEMRFSPYWSTEYTIIVEPRDNLTRIAEEISKLAGRPVNWQEIYRQNQDIIKNSNLIYPNQKLTYEHSETAGRGLHIIM